MTSLKHKNLRHLQKINSNSHHHPLEKVNQNILNKVPKICGVAFIKKSYFKNGIVIAHEGYLINRKNLIHASSKEKMTVNVDFFTYLLEKEKGRFDGVMFYDIKEG